MKPFDPPLQLQPSQRNLVDAEDVFPNFVAWRRMGLRCALVTLVKIEGGSPRALGSLMAVSEAGHFAGYLSGGCLEKAVALEAQRCIAEGKNRLVRYGKGSPYFDIRLPCGSGIEVYIDQGFDDGQLDRMQELSRSRQGFWHVIDIESGTSSIEMTGDPLLLRSHMDGRVFKRAVLPTIKVLLLGIGPSVAAIAHMVSSIGFLVDVASPDEATRQEVRSFGLAAREMVGPEQGMQAVADPWSAAILAFHEHQWEVPVLTSILQSACFYIGVLGSNAVAERRTAALRAQGLSASAIERIHAPVGLILATKSRLSLAVSVVSELVSEAKARGFVS